MWQSGVQRCESKVAHHLRLSRCPDRKLFLMLDIDNTMLHAAFFQNVPEPHASRLPALLEAEQKLLPEQRTLHHMPHLGMWLKLRPFVRQFLRRVSERYTPYIYTAGTRAYAMEVCHLLDPEGRVFAGQERVVSRVGGSGLTASAAAAHCRLPMSGSSD